MLLSICSNCFLQTFYSPIWINMYPYAWLPLISFTTQALQLYFFQDELAYILSVPENPTKYLKGRNCGICACPH
jgi:hypothetical protein